MSSHWDKFLKKALDEKKNIKEKDVKEWKEELKKKNEK